ncbi:GNAT family N-acetyltransferase [uncultured Bifidobacterium sp.]|uniref:GNAT family N-acetyltransferase n=1 Tax=uncultured Bifidobacterium sp. TaxID=165187 RepID=UPI0028DB61E0|nr:GNAT family N-acetyltransferase [uncultured Bifidobacterium sp.]
MSRCPSLSIRPFSRADLDQVAVIYDDMWGSRSHSERGLSLLVSRHHLLHYLVSATGADVAELEGEVLGVVAVRVEGEPTALPWASRMLDEVNGDIRALGDEGVRALDAAETWHALDAVVERESGVRSAAPAEIGLFLVSSRARGHGVGGALWRSAMDGMARHGVLRYFLHTDSGCDVGFYGHEGLERTFDRQVPDDLAGHALHSDAEGDVPRRVFLYEGSPLDGHMGRGHAIRRRSGARPRHGSSVHPIV